MYQMIGGVIIIVVGVTPPVDAPVAMPFDPGLRSRDMISTMDSGVN